MRKIILTVNLILFAGLIFTACEEEIYPKGPLEELYVLTCVLNANSDHQIAFLTRSYDVEGFDPLQNNISPSIEGAVITLNSNGVVYTFRDTSDAGGLNSRYTGEIHYYYLDGFIPAANEEVSIEASLPDGTVVYGETTTFPVTLYGGSFYRSDALIPPENPAQSNLYFKWGDFPFLVHFIPRFNLVYSRTINGEEVFGQLEIPQYIENGEPKYPGILSGDNMYYWMDGVEWAFNNLAEPGVSRETYKIYSARFTILIPDNPLATFYSAAKTFNDSYTVHLTEPEYTNIENGLGIFGSYIIYDYEMNISDAYIDAFGFTFED